MKIKLEPQVKKCANQYPYIGIHMSDLTRPDPLIVYFIAPFSGVSLCVNDGCEPSHRLVTNWSEEIFEPYRGKITLQND